MRQLTILILTAMMAFSAYAELRVWTDLNGNQLEAEFIRSSGKNIILKKADGTQLSVPPMKLSEEDRTYLQGKVPDDLIDPTKSALDRPNPLRIDVKTSKKTDTVKSDGFVNRDVTVVVKVRKRSLEPYDRTLTAELFVVGVHKGDEYLVLLDRTKQEFDFKMGDDAEMQSKVTHIRYFDVAKNGVEYNGNVVVIRDDEGNILEAKGSNRTYERMHEHLIKFKRDDVFTEKTFIKKGTRSSLNIPQGQRGANFYL